MENVELHKFLLKDKRESLQRMREYKAQRQSREKGGQSHKHSQEKGGQSKRQVSGVSKQGDNLNSANNQTEHIQDGVKRKSEMDKR